MPVKFNAGTYYSDERKLFKKPVELNWINFGVDESKQDCSTDRSFLAVLKIGFLSARLTTWQKKNYSMLEWKRILLKKVSNILLIQAIGSWKSVFQGVYCLISQCLSFLQSLHLKNYVPAFLFRDIVPPVKTLFPNRMDVLHCCHSLIWACLYKHSYIFLL